MKKRFLSLLLIVFTLLMLLSCSNQLKTKSNVSLNFPVNDIRNSLSARGIWDGKDSEYISSFELEVKLFVNEKLFDSPKTLRIEKDDDINNKSITFNNIPYDSTIYAEAKVYVSGVYEEKKYSYTIMYGQSDKIVFDSETKELPLKLNWYEDETRFVPPEPAPIILIDTIKYQFYTQKDGTDPDNVENYELANTISIDINPTNASKYYEYLKSAEIVMQIMDVQFDMEVGGFEEYDALSNAEPEIVDKTVYVKSYWIKTGTGITPQTFNSVSTNEEDAYTLYFYDDRYVIKNHADQKVAYGTFYTVRPADGGNNYKFIFCQERAYKDGVPFMLYSMHETPNSFDTCNYNETNNTVTLNCMDSSRNTTPITFTIPGTIDLSAYSYSSLSGNIVYAGIPKVTITYNSSPQMPNLSSGSITFTATLQNEAENPDLDMTAELYFQGRKVASSDYLVDFDAVNKLLTVSPVALSSGGTYIVKVIAMSTSSGTAYTVSNNFIIDIDGYIRKTLDVSDAYFINDLMEFIPTVNGPAEITLTGTKNLNDVSEYTVDNNLYAYMASALSMTSQPVTLDMTNVSGTATQIFDTSTLASTSCKKIKLPGDIKIIYYKEKTPIDISETVRSSETEKWYFMEIAKNSFPQTFATIINELLTGVRTMDTNTQTEITNLHVTQVTEFNWRDISEIVTTDNLSTDEYITYANTDYIFIKK